MMSHNIEPRVYTINAVVYKRSKEMSEESEAFPYIKEKTSLEDSFITPAAEMEPPDELFAMVTALQTDFNIA